MPNPDSANLTANQLYPQFANLLDNLYGADSYFLDRSVTRVEGSEQYEITPIVDSHSQSILGYYEENRDDLVYYHHDAAAKTITMHSINRQGDFEAFVADVSNDPLYISQGIDLNYTNTAARIFGWGKSYLSDDCIDGKRYWKQNKRFLGIRVNVRNVTGSDGEDMYAPCE